MAMKCNEDYGSARNNIDWYIHLKDYYDKQSRLPKFNI